MFKQRQNEIRLYSDKYIDFYTNPDCKVIQVINNQDFTLQQGTKYFTNQLVRYFIGRLNAFWRYIKR